jgi:protein SHQ1
MITPRFKLSQDENCLFVTIHAPFSKVSDAEIYMDGTDFRFHSNPYYIRLNLPGEIIENDEAKANFDAETNEFKITCPKVTKGTHFQGLDMLTSLLAPKGKRSVDSKGIEVLEETCSEEDSESDFDWFLEQKIEEESSDLPANGSKYGFGLKHSGLFATLAEELHQVVDVKNPDNQSASERRIERLEQEKREFNAEHYLADFFQTDMIDPLIEYLPSSRIGEEWTEAETILLKTLTNKEYLLDHDQLQSTYLGLVDILLAYCYDMRTTMSDPNVESAWTIAKISGTLSWLEVFFFFFVYSLSKLRLIDYLIKF